MGPGPLDYRGYIKQALADRCGHNPRYSMRAMARDLKISPSKLSEILAGKRGLSKERGRGIATLLGLSDTQKKRFCDLIEAAHARNPVMREAAALRLSHEARSPAYLQLELDAFHVISDWYHLAIIELCKLKGFRSDPAWIAASLGIRPVEAEMAIERLERMDLLRRKKGKLVARPFEVASPSGIPSDAIKKFHSQVLKKAAAALVLQSVDERDFSAMVFACDERDLPRMKAKLKEFRRGFSAQASQAPRKKSVYCFSMQLFRMNRKEKPS